MTARRVRLSALVLRALLLAALVVGSSGAPEAETPPFDKDNLEALLRKEHSQRVSNIYDSEKGIQYTWNIEKQELCPGVDGVCSKDEL